VPGSSGPQSLKKTLVNQGLSVTQDPSWASFVTNFFTTGGFMKMMCGHDDSSLIQ
jgi:hypothetical protein